MNTEGTKPLSQIELPFWFYEFLGINSMQEGERFILNGTEYEWRNGFPR